MSSQNKKEGGLTKGKRQYNNTFPSVTMVLDILRKKGLEFWFKNNTLAFITKESEEGKLIGRQIHEVIQQHIDKEEVKVETQYGEQVMNALNAFMLFKKEHPEIKLHKAEMAFTSEKYGYNGTLDCIATIKKDIVLFDWKTGKAKDKDIPAIYDEYKYQVAFYVKAFNEIQEEQIKRAFILSLAKDKITYNLEEIAIKDIEEMFQEICLPALKIWNYQNRRV